MTPDLVAEEDHRAPSAEDDRRAGVILAILSVATAFVGIASFALWVRLT